MCISKLVVYQIDVDIDCPKKDRDLHMLCLSYICLFEDVHHLKHIPFQHDTWPLIEMKFVLEI